MLTLDQVEWASQYEWFHSCYEQDAGFEVCVIDGSSKLVFDNFDDLQEWAGV